MLNFPNTPTEHKAVMEYFKQPHVIASLARKRGGEDVARDAAADAVPSPPPRKRKRLARSAASDDNAAAGPSEEPSAGAAIVSAPFGAAPLPPAAAAAAAAADAAAFLCSIKPSLQDLDAIVQELHATGLSMAHLNAVAKHNGAPAFALMRDDLFKALKITRFADQLSFTVALSALAP